MFKLIFNFNVENSGFQVYSQPMKFVYCLLLLSLCQCGYNWGHGKRTLPGGHKTVFVEIFENNTKEVGAEFAFTNALSKELERSGFVIVTTKNQAEVIIQGTILEVLNVDSASQPDFFAVDYQNMSAQGYSASFFTNYSMVVASNLKAVRSRDEQVIWQTNLRGQKDYRGSLLKKQGIRSSNVLYNQSRRKQTMALIAEDMMREAFDRLTENF